MEERLKKKADAAALDWKCDRKDMENLVAEAKSSNISLHSEISQVRETVRLTSDGLAGVRKKNDEFAAHQKKFGGIIRRFETEVEDARHSIQYLKTSTTAHQEAKNNTEESIHRIRSIQNNIEEKQKAFQSALEDLSNEYKRTDLRFASLADDIKLLREQKADEVVVHNALSEKAEKKNSVSEMKMNEFELDIDQRLKKMEQMISGNESNTQRWMGQIMDQLEKALTMKKNELNDIRDYIDHRFQTIGQNGEDENNHINLNNKNDKNAQSSRKAQHDNSRNSPKDKTKIRKSRNGDSRESGRETSRESSPESPRQSPMNNRMQRKNKNDNNALSNRKGLSPESPRQSPMNNRMQRKNKN